MDNHLKHHFPHFKISDGFMVREEKSWKYIIELPVLPFSFEGEEYLTSLRLNNVDFKTASLSHLTEKTFKFPINPQEGYVDASIYAGGVHVPIEVTEIGFSKILNYRHISLVQTKFKTNFLFEEIMLENMPKTINTNLIIYRGG